MKTFPAASEPDGRLRAFEVENAYIGPSAVAQVLRGTEGVTDVEQRRLFSRDSEVHVKFKCQGHPCIVWEPYGDNSRFWIGPESKTPLQETWLLWKGPSLTTGRHCTGRWWETS
jgi:hypothetical protein